jgi:hypothetical protein
MVRCAQCGRKMQGSWNHGQAYYRCKFPTEYAVAQGQHGECDTKLARYRELLEQDADITVAATWIAEVERDRRVLANYDELGVNLTYHPDGRVHVGAGAHGFGVRVGGGLEPPRPLRALALNLQKAVPSGCSGSIAAVQVAADAANGESGHWNQLSGKPFRIRFRISGPRCDLY